MNDEFTVNDIVFEVLEHGDMVTSGMQHGRVLEVTSCILPELLRRSVEGMYWPYRLHDTAIAYDYDRGLYLIMISEEQDAIRLQRSP